MSSQDRYREIYTEKALMNGGLTIGGGRKKKSKKKGGASHKSGHQTAAAHNPWIKFVKKWAKQHGMTYGEALGDSRVKTAYHKS